MWSFLKQGVTPERVSDKMPFIPRILWQTTKDSRAIARELAACMDKLKAMNPSWEHRLHDDASQREFLESVCSDRFLKAYDRIEQRYGAARSDMFRYVVVFLFGGVYLDLKSGTSRPLDEIILPDDHFILSKWDNKPGGLFEDMGFHKRLRAVEDGEYEQWFIISEPGHPFLAETIENMLQIIETYNPFVYRDGAMGVLNVTGPVVYTLSIHGIKDQHKARQITSWKEGLQYTLLESPVAHQAFDKGHYSRITKLPVTNFGLRDWPLIKYNLLKLAFAPVSKYRVLNSAHRKRRWEERIARMQRQTVNLPK